MKRVTVLALAMICLLGVSGAQAAPIILADSVGLSPFDYEEDYFHAEFTVTAANTLVKLFTLNTATYPMSSFNPTLVLWGGTGNDAPLVAWNQEWYMPLDPAWAGAYAGDFNNYMATGDLGTLLTTLPHPGLVEDNGFGFYIPSWDAALELTLGAGDYTVAILAAGNKPWDLGITPNGSPPTTLGEGYSATTQIAVAGVDPSPIDEFYDGGDWVVYIDQIPPNGNGEIPPNGDGGVVPIPGSLLLLGSGLSGLLLLRRRRS